MIKLQKRDLENLVLIYEQKFLTSGHTQRAGFQECHQSLAYRRMADLEEAGLIRRSKPFQGSNLIAYVLTKKGVEEVKRWTDTNIRYSPRINLSNFEHDSMVTDVRLRLCEYFKTGNPKWTPEILLRRIQIEPFSSTDPSRTIGDGIISLENGKKFAIEVENSVKAKDRIESILRSWATGWNVNAVFYITTLPSITRRIKKSIQELFDRGEKVNAGVIELEQIKSDLPLQLWTPRGIIQI